MKEKILELLKEKEFQTFHHIPADTSQEVAKIRGTDPRIGAKALIIRSKGEFYLCVLRGTDKLDAKKLRKNSGIKKFSFITQNELKEIFNLEKGAVPPFGNLIPNIKDTFFEKDLVTEKYFAFNIGTKTDSIKIEGQVVLDYVKPKIIDFKLVD
ncbi:hypothetical protein CL656_06545 [bacterium]|nr:hypothetical protein [bacterium]|tara:strand:+ start:10490 stop:10951 length:462 start_codon:yes stop_codon:yes gene_type:complete